MDRKGVGSIVVLLVVCGFLGAIGVAPTVSHHTAVQENQPTEATVQSTDIDVKTDDDGDKSYSPVVTYEYTVDGQTYTEDNVFPGGFQRYDGSRSWAANVVDQYEPGDQVTVYYRPGAPSHAYLRNDGLPDSMYIGVIAVLVAIGGGIGLVTTGFRRRKQRTLMRDTPTEDVEALSVGSSEVEGTAVVEDGDPIRAPFSEDDCVVAEYEVEQDDEGDDDDPGSWHTVETGVVHTPFHVDDGTGTVRVEPHDEATFDLDPDDWETTYVDSGAEGPEPVRGFVRSSDGLSFPSNASGKENDRRYKQNLIRHEESAYVFGTAQPRDGDLAGASSADRLVIRKVTDDDALEAEMFLVSDDAESSLVDRREWAGLRIPAGGLYLVAGFAGAVFMLAPMVGVEIPVVL
jgi:hypothetical protein